MSVNPAWTSKPKVPEPAEIRRWFRETSRRLRRYMRDPERQMLAVLLLLAALLRLIYLDLTPLTTSQASHLMQARDIRWGDFYPLVGLSGASGITNGPWFSYLLAIPLVFGRDPRWISAVLALANVLAVLLLYRLVRRHLGARIALVASLLLVTSPWAILFARNIDYAAVLLPLSIVHMATLYAALASDRAWGWAAAWASLALMLGISFHVLPLVLVLLVLSVLYYQRIRWPHYLLGMLVAGLLLLPYFYAQNERGFGDIIALWSLLIDPPLLTGRSADLLQWAIRLHSGQGLDTLTAQQASLTVSRLDLLGQIAAVLFLFGLPVLVIRALRSWSQWREGAPDHAAHVIVTVWLIVPLLATRLYPRPLAPAALAILMPAGFVAMGVAVDALLSWPRALETRRSDIAQVVRLAMLVVIAALVLWQLYGTVSFFGHVGNNDVTATYGVPYRYWRRTTKLVRREVAQLEGVHDIWVMGTMVGERIDLRIPLTYLLEPEIQPVFIPQNDDPALLLPTARPAIYLFGESVPPAETTLRQIGASRRGLVVFPDEEIQTRVYALEGQPIEDLLARIQHRGLWALDSGAYLVGYDWPPNATPGREVLFATYWTFLNVPVEETESDHEAFAVLVNPQGQPVARAEGFGLDERYWQQGVLFKQWWSLELPPDAPTGSYAILTGMYHTADGAYNRHINAQGHDLGRAIPLGPVGVSAAAP